MRRLVAVATAAVVLPAAWAAIASAAVAVPSLRIALSSPKVVYGHALKLSGRLSSGQAGHTVGLYSKQYGKQRMRWVASVKTGADGRFSYPVAPSILTVYEARSGTTASRRVTLGVEPAIELNQLAGGQITARISAGKQFTGSKIELQRPNRADWTTLETAVLGPGSNATFASPIASGSATLRVAISVNQAGAGYLGSHSAAFRYRARSVTLVPSSLRVIYGDSLVLSGRISSHQSGELVAILGSSYGSSVPARLATVITGAGGNWTLRAKPSIQTSYVARWSGNLSRALKVGVEPRLTLSLDGGRIQVHVSSSRELAGRKVELQQRTAAGSWRTVDELPLDRRSNVAFPSLLTSGRVTLRVALSVNQAGFGLLGSASPSFLYLRT